MSTLDEHTLCAICDCVTPPYAPLSLCLQHMKQAYLYVRDIIEMTELGDIEYRPIPAPTPTHVYYVLFGDRIKIGTSSDVWMRIRNLPCDELLAIEPGDSTKEHERHWQFNRVRVAHNSEWFYDCPRLRKHINALRKQYGVPVAP